MAAVFTVINAPIKQAKLATSWWTWLIKDRKIKTIVEHLAVKGLTVSPKSWWRPKAELKGE